MAKNHVIEFTTLDRTAIPHIKYFHFIRFSTKTETLSANVEHTESALTSKIQSQILLKILLRNTLST